jgi:hypothetical protein
MPKDLRTDLLGKPVYEKVTVKQKNLMVGGEIIGWKGPPKAPEPGPVLEPGLTRGQREQMTRWHELAATQPEALIPGVEKAPAETAPVAPPKRLPSRVTYHKGSIQSAIKAVRRLKSDKSKFIYATGNGLTIGDSPPPFDQPSTEVHPDGTVETHMLTPGREPEAPPLFEQPPPAKKIERAGPAPEGGEPSGEAPASAHLETPAQESGRVPAEDGDSGPSL